MHTYYTINDINFNQFYMFFFPLSLSLTHFLWSQHGFFSLRLTMWVKKVFLWIPFVDLKFPGFLPEVLAFFGSILETEVVFITLKRDVWNSWVAPPDSENSWHPKSPCRHRSKPCRFAPPRMVSRHTKTGVLRKSITFNWEKTSFFFDFMNWWMIAFAVN